MLFPIKLATVLPDKFVSTVPQGMALQHHDMLPLYDLRGSRWDPE